MAKSIYSLVLLVLCTADVPPQPALKSIPAFLPVEPGPWQQVLEHSWTAAAQDLYNDSTSTSIDKDSGGARYSCYDVDVAATSHQQNGAYTARSRQANVGKHYIQSAMRLLHVLSSRWEEKKQHFVRACENMQKCALSLDSWTRDKGISDLWT